MTELPYLAHGPVAQAFAEQSEDYGYLYDRGQSIAWVGSRWSVGDKGDLLLRAAIGEFCNRLYALYPVESKRHVLLDSRFRQGVLYEAKPLVPKWKFSEDFDRDDLLLGVPGNRVIDLRTGALRAMRREDHVTKRTRIAPDSKHKAARFLLFMEEISCGDIELSAYLLRYCGYVLTASTKAQCLPFWYGHGANGKGTLLNVLHHILGHEYGTVLRMSNLSRKEKEDDSQRRVIAKLCGARLATANEGNVQVKLDMSLLKSLASSDLLTGAFLYENEFVFQPSHKLIIATNHKPDLEVDTAARRRVHLVPFDAEFTGPKENNNLDHELQAEAPGIMHLMVQACVEWQTGGLAPPKRVSDATARLFDDLDPIGRFAKEQLIEDPEGFLTSEDLKIAYGGFLGDNGLEAYIDERELIGRLKALPGVTRVTRGPEGARQRGLAGRKIKGTRITGGPDVPTGRITRID
jgi:putative DNA primase/helicase